MPNRLKVKVRGIYSTALTKFFVNNGLEIVSPSETINERFDIGDCPNEGADVLVYDKADMNGVTINGAGAERIVTIIQSYFYDVAVKKVETGAIYAGKVKLIDTKLNNLHVDLGNGEEGILSLQNYWGFLREGEKVLVQVKGAVRGVKILSTNLRLFGNNMVLIKGGFTKVSKHIKDPKIKQKLIDLANSAKIEGWGILWKSHAEGKTDQELISELNKLINLEKNIKEKFNKANQPGLIESGTCAYFVDFGALSKQTLDKIRKSVAPTITGHHFLKSGGYFTLTDFAESLQIDEQQLVVAINNALRAEGPKPGMFFKIIHKKAGGRDVVLNGTVEHATDKEIVIKRRLLNGGRLDGLNLEINEGDYALTIIQPNSWFVTHKYFNKEGFQKGLYININTPVEVYPKFARYIDLEVDVVEKANKREIIDVNKLNQILNAGIIKKELADKALEIANQLASEGPK